MNNLTRVFLVLLRLALGWVILVEGLDKIRSDNWSSAPYLREATGPLAGHFRSIAGDPVELRLVPAPLPAGADPAKTPLYQRMPPELARDWQRYHAGFVAHYQLDEQQRRQAEVKLLQSEDQAVHWLLHGKRVVKVTSPWAPPAPLERTTPERVGDYLAKRNRAVEIETKELPVFGSEINARLQAAKAEAGQIRNELLGSPARTAEWLKQIDTVEKPLLDKKKQAGDLAIQIKDAEEKIHKAGKEPAENGNAPTEQVEKLKKSLTQMQAKKKEADTEVASLQDRYAGLIVDLDISKQSALMRRKLQSVLTAEQLKRDPLPERPPTGWNVREWTRLEWSDNLVKYGLTAVGFCLLAGLFTRSACVFGAFLLLMFVLAMPPLPGLPDNPKVEGHYLFVNKTMIMALALLALATTRSGRWLGIDGVFQFLNPWRERDEEEPEEKPKPLPADLGAATPRPDLEPATALTPTASTPDNGAGSFDTAPTPKESSDGH